MKYDIIFNPVAFTRAAVDAVQETLVEAMILAVIVVMLFLQRWRTAIIPLLAIPVSLIGTLSIMSLFGFSLNNLSMFGLVLSIGIVVDDAIVVVENAERHLRAGMRPREAAHLTMDECGGALIGIALVLVAVFVPTAFMGGIAGAFYKQFALTIASATVISLLVSLTLSPALAAVILTPHDATPSRTRIGARLHALAEGANSWLERLSAGYASFTGAALRHRTMLVALYGGLVVLTAWRADRHAARLRAGAGPERRRGLAHDAARRRASRAPTQSCSRSFRSFSARRACRPRPSMRAWMAALLERHERRPDLGDLRSVREAHPEGPVAAPTSRGELRKRLAGITAGEIRVVNQASVRGMGNAGGFQMMIEDRGGLGYRALEDAVQRAHGGGAARIRRSRSRSATSTRATRRSTPSSTATKPRCSACRYATCSTTLQTYLAGTYVNNINMLGHTFQVIAQGDAATAKTRVGRAARRRARPPARWCRSTRSRSSCRRLAPYRVPRYNLYPAADIQGDTARRPLFGRGDGGDGAHRARDAAAPV